MATTKSTKPAETEEAEVEVTTKSVINEGIAKVIAATGIDVQKNRYKAMRAIAFEAFAQAIENDTFEALVDAAIANIDDLPSGWEIERNEKVAAPAKAKATPAKATPAKAASKATPAKAATAARPARRRPTR